MELSKNFRKHIKELVTEMCNFEEYLKNHTNSLSARVGNSTLYKHILLLLLKENKDLSVFLVNKPLSHENINKTKVCNIRT